jgi:hypothetical protein
MSEQRRQHCRRRRSLAAQETTAPFDTTITVEHAPAARHVDRTRRGIFPDNFIVVHHHHPGRDGVIGILLDYHQSTSGQQRMVYYSFSALSRRPILTNRWTNPCRCGKRERNTTMTTTTTRCVARVLFIDGAVWVVVVVMDAEDLKE